MFILPNQAILWFTFVLSSNIKPFYYVLYLKLQIQKCFVSKTLVMHTVACITKGFLLMMMVFLCASHGDGATVCVIVKNFDAAAEKWW